MRNDGDLLSAPATERQSTLRDEAPWLGIALAVGAFVGVNYLLTNPYTAYESGLYLQLAERIVASGYSVPSTHSIYEATGVPFTHVPLMFYVYAVLIDVAGVSPATLGRYLPLIVATMYLIPYYFIAREFLDTKLEATLATMLLAVTPLLEWHLTTGGLIRAPAFLFSLAGIYVAIRLFESWSVRLLAPATLLFGLTLLTDPVYAVFLVVSCLLFYLALDRSLRGAVVIIGGIALVVPWWTQVITTYGVGVIAPAEGIDSWLFAVLSRFTDGFVFTLGQVPSISAFFVLTYAGLFYYIGTRRYLLPAWLLVPTIALGTERFQFVAGTLMGAAVLYAGVRKLARRRIPAENWRTASRVAVAGIVIGSVAIGTMYGGALPVADTNDLKQEFVDHLDSDAVAWITQHTNLSVEFAIPSAPAGWFPVLTDISRLVSPWDVARTSGVRDSTQPSLYEQLSTCETGACVMDTLASWGLTPEFLYVPKGQYTVSGKTYDGTRTLQLLLIQSDLFRLVFENEGAYIFRATGDIGTTPRVTTRGLEWAV